MGIKGKNNKTPSILLMIESLDLPVLHIVGVFPLMLPVKKCHPDATQIEIFRVAETLSITKTDANSGLISSILKSHGYGHAGMDTGPILWGRIQRSIEEVERVSKNKISGRDKKHREDTLFNDQDNYHRRLECLRELFFNSKAQVKATCIQFLSYT